jgi:hypothetical protein
METAMTAASGNAAQSLSRPGMMGDGTEEQNLNQAGDPAARIGQDEVASAFGANGVSADGTRGDAGESVPSGGELERRITGNVNADLAAADAPGNLVPGEDLRERQEQLIDEAVEETFPASDPIAPKRITK